MACGVPVIAANTAAMSEIASSQLLLPGLKLHKRTDNRTAIYWTTESMGRYAAALSLVLENKHKYDALVQGAITESKNSDPLLIAAKWFKFIYTCQKLSK